MSKKYVRSLILSIEYAALLGSIVLIFYSAFNSRWEVTAAALAVIAAIIANFNSQRISWKQEDEYEADIDIDFDLKTINKRVLLYVENTGGSKAYNISIKISPELKTLKDETINRKNLKYLNKNERVQYYVSSSVDMFAENVSIERPTEYKVDYSFAQSENGKILKRQKTISIENFRKTTSSDSDLENFYIKNANISDKLDKLEKTISKISNK